jgi:hypothetical protein
MASVFPIVGINTSSEHDIRTVWKIFVNMEVIISDISFAGS